VRAADRGDPARPPPGHVRAGRGVLGRGGAGRAGPAGAGVARAGAARPGGAVHPARRLRRGGAAAVGGGAGGGPGGPGGAAGDRRRSAVRGDGDAGAGADGRRLELGLPGGPAGPGAAGAGDAAARLRRRPLRRLVRGAADRRPDHGGGVRRAAARRAAPHRSRPGRGRGGGRRRNGRARAYDPAGNPVSPGRNACLETLRSSPIMAMPLHKTRPDAGPSPVPVRARRIMISTDTYPPDVNGTAYFAHRLATGLAARGNEVHVVCQSDAGPAGTGVEDGVVVHRLRSAPLLVHPTMRVTVPTRLDRLMAEVDPDVLHTQGHFVVGRAALAAARRRGVPVVATNHFMPDNLFQFGHIPDRLREGVGKLAWRDFGRVFRKADRVTTPTPLAAALLAEQGFDRPVEPVSCGID